MKYGTLDVVGFYVLYILQCMTVKTKLITLLSFTSISILFLAGCITTPQSQSTKLPVVASFYPIYFFASEIGGDKVDVKNITPPGTEPHDYELTPRDIANIYDSKLLVLNGGQLEPWADTVTAQLSSGTVVVTAGQDITTRLMMPQDDLTNIDPHVWLSPKLAQHEVKKITLGYIQADPKNSAYYLGEQNELLQQLAQLDNDYQQGLAQCASHDIITSHTAFSYLAAEYGLNEVAISGLSPDEEPSPAQLANVVQFANTHQVQYIFFESLVSPKLAETIASEVGAQTLVLDPIEGLTDEEIQQGANYFTVMRTNLQNLRTALQCK